MRARSLGVNWLLAWCSSSRTVNLRSCDQTETIWPMQTGLFILFFCLRIDANSCCWRKSLPCRKCRKFQAQMKCKQVRFNLIRFWLPCLLWFARIVNFYLLTCITLFAYKLLHVYQFLIKLFISTFCLPSKQMFSHFSYSFDILHFYYLAVFTEYICFGKTRRFNSIRSTALCWPLICIALINYGLDFINWYFLGVSFQPALFWAKRWPIFRLFLDFGFLAVWWCRRHCILSFQSADGLLRRFSDGNPNNCWTGHWMTPNLLFWRVS